ncbi:MAG TPA: MBL fold metallo-hydrolase [Candidatus Paceibacterota bacterium]|nr:MBL fold metallo-hydrolase [Candidatus Paceibacterota bacterium]
MNKKFARLGLLLLVSILVAIALILMTLVPKQNKMTKVFMFDVGQGDSFFIETKSGKQMLIDGGKDATVLSELTKAMPWWDKSIDIVLATHPDMDHIGGLDDVLKRYKVGLFVTSEVGGETDEYENLMTLVNKQKIPAYFVRAGMKFDFSDTEYFEILFPDRSVEGWETNTGSVVGKFVAGPPAGGASILFTGDSPAPIEQYLAKSIPDKLNVDILKLGHHGSRTSTTSAYLKATTPSLALISAGKNNSYGHPHKEVLDLLKQFKTPYLSTQTEGTVLFETDGVKWYRLPAQTRK